MVPNAPAGLEPGLAQLIQKWWKRHTLTFLLPVMYKAHTHDWMSISMDCVGCRLCGVVHICGIRDNIVPCSLQLQEDSSMVCTYTGIVVKTTTLYDGQTSVAEYQADHLHPLCAHSILPAKKCMSMAHKIDIVTRITSDVIDQLFFSEQARSARDFEMQRYNRKIKKSFADYLSKSRVCFAQANLLDALEASMRAMSSFRKPVQEDNIPPRAHFVQVQRAIVILLSRLKVPRPYVFTENSDKIKNLVVSMIYVARDGICFKGQVYLPKFPVLASILPLELALSKCFETQPKIVTDGENIVKMCIKNTNFCTPLEFPTHICAFETTGHCTCAQGEEHYQH